MKEDIAIRPGEILMPAQGIQPEKWACVACDQYTSQPEYWEKIQKDIGDAPSTFRLMLPECWLSESEARVPKIHQTMKENLESGILFPAVKQGYVLCERTIASGTRLGLVCTVDLEDYSFEKGSMPLVRPTEQTIPSRLPARLAIRRGASIELSHIMILIDDPERTVLEPLQAKKDTLRKLYDFELMADGGHLAGWAIEDEDTLQAVQKAMENLKKSLGKDPMLLAVGDGNHSLATAKAYWEEIKTNLSEKERETHPARFALCEIENIHDEALLFEPIHRILTHTTPEAVYDYLHEYAQEKGLVLSPEKGTHTFTFFAGEKEQTVSVQNPDGAIPTETIQRFLDAFLEKYPEAEIDFIHGEDALRKLSQRENTVGFLLPPIDKHSFFQDVIRLGVLPRKTFSMGEANEKRFYMEAKRI